MFFSYIFNFLNTGEAPEAAAYIGSATRQTFAPNSLEQTTLNLLKSAEDYSSAAPSKKPEILGKLVSTAIQRKQFLLSLIEGNPSAVLRVAIPKKIKAKLPFEIQNNIEEETQIEGDLTVLHADDFQKGISKFYYFLTSNAGERILLNFASKAPVLLTGSRIRAKGFRIDNTMALESGTTSVQTLSTAVLPNTFGAQKTLVINVNFVNNPIEPYTIDFVRNVLFNTTSNFDLENSFQQTWLTGDSVGWYTLAINSTVCDYNSIASQAKSAATAAGVNLANYNRYVYSFPGNSCSWWGLGTVGGNPSQAWINGNIQLRVVGHEMGHNFGLYHSHALECGSITLGTNCSSIEYGDYVDIMGSSSGHFNTFQKERLGWLNYNTQPLITTISSDGIYSIDQYETLNSNTKGLKIYKSSDPTTGRKTWFYAEYRQPIGFDKFVSTNTNILNGVVIHLGTDSTPNSAYLLDMTPETSSWSDPALDVGKTFYDSVSGVSITTMSAAPPTATVSVSYGPVSCVHTSPTIVISPTSQWGSPGNSLTYTTTLTNNDETVCSSSVYSITPTLPAGWSQTPTTLSANLAPKTSVNMNIAIVSDINAQPAYYQFSETAVNDQITPLSSSAAANYNIMPADTTPPGVSIIKPLNGSTITKGTLKISATASDISGISVINILSDNAAIKTCYGTTTCNANLGVSQISPGFHTIIATAADNSLQQNIGSAFIVVKK